MRDETPEERKARWKSITLGGRRPGGQPSPEQKPRPVEQPVWEGTPVTEKRPGGFEVPLIHNSDHEPVTAKQYANRRGHYDAQRKALKSSTNPFQAT